MAGKLRVEYAGAIYHVMNPGPRREPIFRGEADRQHFAETLGETCAKTGWQLHAHCLMPDHFDLVTETPQANLVAGMRWFLSTSTSRFNRRHKLFGHLSSGRYKALVGRQHKARLSEDGVRRGAFESSAGEVADPGQAFKDYRWSSWPEYVKPPGRRWPWLRVDRLLSQWGVKADYAAGRRQLARDMEQRKELEESQETSDWKRLRRGWCWGARDFRKRMLELIGQPQGRQPHGEQLRQSEAQKAQRLVGAMLRGGGVEGNGLGPSAERRPAQRCAWR